MRRLRAALGAGLLPLAFWGGAPARADKLPSPPPTPPPTVQPAVATAPAAGSAECTVRIIHARPGAGDVDPRLGAFKARLSKPPLSSWKSFKLLREQDLKVGAAQPATFAVPGDHEGALQFLGRVEGDKQRLRMRLEIRDGRAHLLRTVFVIDNGGTVLHGGIKHEDGVLVTGITCHLP